MRMRSKVSAVFLTAVSSIFLAEAFIEDIFQQAFGGGGGGGVQFEMGGGGGMFQQMGGGRQKRKPKWPNGVSDKITKKYAFLKGTEWNWNNWRNVKFNRDGTFEAPTRECQGDSCKWSANKGKVFILWGEAGLHELTFDREIPEDQDPNALAGLRISGRRLSDNDKCHATFQRVFDFEAAQLEKDLYGDLGLPDDAEEADIKKAYRKLSVKYHPDKNPDAESQAKFKAVRDAYEILNDPDNKILYDTGGMEAVKSHQKGEVQKGDDIPSELEVTLEDFYNTGDRSAQLERRVVCRGCRVKPDSPKCKGCGRCPNEVKMVNVQVGPGMVMQQQQEVQSKEKCKNEMSTLAVHIEKGMQDGEKLKFERAAEQRPGMLPGAVVFTLRTQKHKKFVRKGDDLHMKMSVSLREALIGWDQQIKHLDGHMIEIGTTSVTRPFQVIRVKGEGMPLRDDPSTFGDLHVEVQIIMPNSLTSEQKPLVESLLGPASQRSDL